MPFNLQALATRSRSFRVIEPTAIQSSTLFKDIYLPIITLWASAAQDMLAAYPQAVASGSVEALTAEDKSAQHDAEVIISALALWSFFAGLEQWHRRKWLSSVSNAAGVDVGVLLDRPTGMQGGAAVVMNRAGRRAERAALVKAAKQAVRVSGGSLLSSATLTGVDAVLGNAVAANAALVRIVSEQARARIANVVFNGVATGQSAEDVARELRKGLAVSKKRALSVAKDQTVKATKALNRFRITEAGWTEAQYNHLAGQLHPRLNHQAIDKQVLKLSDPRWAWLNEPNCHCTMSPPPLLVLGRNNAT